MIADDIRNLTAELAARGEAALRDPAFFRGLLINLELTTDRVALLERQVVPPGLSGHLPAEVACLAEVRMRRTEAAAQGVAL